jgi:cytochrome c
VRRLVCAAAALSVLLPVAGAVAQESEPVVDVLVYTETTGFRHASIADGVAFFQRLAADDGVEGADFRVEVVNDSVGHFTDQNLSRFEVVAFLSTTGNPLDLAEQAAFERFVQGGGGYVGVHAAADGEYTWPWYGDLVGAYFESHPLGTPQATIDVEDRDHASTRHLPPRWTRVDEWYEYRRNPRRYVCNTETEVAGLETQSALEPVPGLPHPLAAFQGRETGIPEQLDDREQRCSVHVLLALDEKTYDSTPPGGRPSEPDDHPIAWCHDYDGGRSFYTGLGHTAESYTEPEFAAHLVGGVLNAAGLADCPKPDPDS